MVLITIVTGAYRPTYNWGASHCVNEWMGCVYNGVYNRRITPCFFLVCIFLISVDWLSQDNCNNAPFNPMV